MGAERALITGCNGFVGRYLAKRLHDAGCVVDGIDLQEEPWADWIEYSKIDITETETVLSLVEKKEPKTIYHLAALANPRICNERPAFAVRVNVQGTVNFFNACLAHSSSRLLVVGSSEEYLKKLGEEIVYREDDLLDPKNIYGATKISAEMIGKTFVSLYGVSAFFTRSFNHTGPGQSSDYVLSDFARQCAEIGLGMKEKIINVGNIDVERDFLDVRDVVEAYIAIVERGMPGESYNVCSGKTSSLRALLERMIDRAKAGKVEIVVDQSRVRLGETIKVNGDLSKIHNHTSWVPSMNILNTVDEMVDYWIGILKSE